MYKFLWTGTNAHGVKRSEFVHAENAEAAKQILLQRGWSDLRLLQDEVGSLAGSDIEAPPYADKEVGAEQLAEFWQGDDAGFLSLWWKSLKESKGTLLLSGGLLALGIYDGRTTLMVIGGGGMGLIAVLFPAIQIFFSLPLRYYEALNRAKVWGRWNDVLRCIERLRQVHGITRLGIGELELTRCRAQALAGLGKLEEGIQEFSRYENDPNVPHWLYLSHLAGVYDIAKQFETSLRLRQQSALEKPDTASTWIDLAYTLVRGLNYPAEARAALAKAEKHELPELAKAYLPFLRGVICWRENNFSEAKNHLDQAVASLRTMPQNALMDGLVLLARSYLCAVNGALGNFDAAKALLGETEKFLIANREDELLEACRQHAMRRA